MKLKIPSFGKVAGAASGRVAQAVPHVQIGRAHV